MEYLSKEGQVVCDDCLINLLQNQHLMRFNLTLYHSDC